MKTITDQEYAFYRKARKACSTHGDPEGPGQMRGLMRQFSKLVHAERDAERAAERKREVV